MLVYSSLQGASLIFLPRWWKLPAVPALLLVPMIVSEWRQPSYMGDVIMAMVMIYGCAYLMFAWIAFGIAKGFHRFRESWGNRICELL
jgi:hypothetical protein